MTSLVCVVSTTKRKKKSMSRFKRLSHTIWHCEYHIVWVPKYRYRVMQGKIKEEVEPCGREQTRQMNCEVQELNVRSKYSCLHDIRGAAKNIDAFGEQFDRRRSESETISSTRNAIFMFRKDTYTPLLRGM
jgi:hypothetical protein